jgi:hypothetical protein
MILTYDDLHNQKQLDDVFSKYSKLFPDNCEITPITVKIAVDNWIPLADFLEDKVCQGAMAVFRLKQDEAVKTWCDAHWTAMRNRKPNMATALRIYRESMMEAYRLLMEYDTKQEVNHDI